MTNEQDLKSLSNKVFVPDATYGLSDYNSDKIASLLSGAAAFFLFDMQHDWIDGFIEQFNWWARDLFWVAFTMLFLALFIISVIYVPEWFNKLLGRTGGVKLAIINNELYTFSIERTSKDDEHEELDAGDLKNLADTTNNKQTIRVWIIENIMKELDNGKQTSASDRIIAKPGKAEVNKDKSKKHLELTVRKCELLGVKILKHGSAVEITYKYKQNSTEYKARYSQKNFQRFADGSLSDYKVLIDKLQEIKDNQKQRSQ